MEMKEITFLEDYRVKVPPGEKGEEFAEGRSYRRTVASCEYFIGRGLARYTDDIKAEAVAAQEAEQQKLLDVLRNDAESAGANAAEAIKLAADLEAKAEETAKDAEAAKKEVSGKKGDEKAVAQEAADVAAQRADDARSAFEEAKKAADELQEIAEAAAKELENATGKGA